MGTIGVSKSGMKGRNWKSQEGEDRWMYRNLFQGMRGSSFVVVEMGALDGIKFSNSFAFEFELGWRAVLIEGSLQNFASLSRNRPGATAMLGAVCRNSTTIHIAGGGPGAKMMEAVPGKTPCMPMSMLLEKAGVTKIDFFSLDVEGAELAAIETHDVPVGAYLVEQINIKRRLLKNAAVREALQSRGFCKMASNVGHQNEVWVNKTFFEASIASSGNVETPDRK